MRKRTPAPERETKNLPAFIKAIDGRTVTGVFAVYGNVDSGKDRIWPGAFTKTLAERAGKILHLWQHDFWSPPIAVIKSIRELTREELPPEVLATAPDALGGVEVTREYLDTERGNAVLAALMAGSPLQMSFGFDVTRYDFEEDPNGDYEWSRIRNVREVRLWEVSDVLWGMNEATVADSSKAMLLAGIEAFETALKSQKSGARHSASDCVLINKAAKILVDLGATNVRMCDEDEEEMPKAQRPPAAKQLDPIIPPEDEPEEPVGATPPVLDDWTNLDAAYAELIA